MEGKSKEVEKEEGRKGVIIRRKVGREEKVTNLRVKADNNR